jgi:hypothetical protein
VVLSEGVIEGVRSNAAFLSKAVYFAGLCMFVTDGNTHTHTHILKIKPMRCNHFSNLFWNRTLHVSDRLYVHHQEASTVYAAIGICHRGYVEYLLADSQHTLYDIRHMIYLLLCIQYWTPDDGQKTCPKHVEFYSKINLRN